MGTKTKRALTVARWNNVYRLWAEGNNLAAIATWLKCHQSTAWRLLKRAALEKQKQPGFTWPVDDTGRKICNIAHPMPKDEDPRQWAHAALRRKMYVRRMIGKPPGPSKVGYCPVCQKGGLLATPTFFVGKPLIEVFAQEAGTKTNFQF